MPNRAEPYHASPRPALPHLTRPCQTASYSKELEGVARYPIHYPCLTPPDLTLPHPTLPNPETLPNLTKPDPAEPYLAKPRPNQRHWERQHAARPTALAIPCRTRPDPAAPRLTPPCLARPLLTPPSLTPTCHTQPCPTISRRASPNQKLNFLKRRYSKTSKWTSFLRPKVSDPDVLTGLIEQLVDIIKAQ